MNKDVKVYRSQSNLRDLRSFVTLMIEDLRKSKALAWRLMLRDINARYRQTFLGYFWALIPPVVVAYSLVIASEARVINIGNTDLPYPAYVMLSMVLWQTFIEAFNAPSQAVAESKVMLAKINFPRESIILAKVGEVIFNFLIKLVLVVFVFVTYHVPLTEMALLAPIGVLSLILLGTFLGVLIAPFGAIYQDISKSILLLTTPWLLITPVLYPVPTTGIFGVIVNLNPVTPLLVTTRELATNGIVSNWSGFLVVSLVASVGLLFSWVLFRLSIPYVIERMPS